MHWCSSVEVSPSQQNPEHWKCKGCSGGGTAMGTSQKLGKWIQNAYFKWTSISWTSVEGHLSSRLCTEVLNSERIKLNADIAQWGPWHTAAHPLLQCSALHWKMYLFSGGQWLCSPTPLWQWHPLCGNSACITKAGAPLHWLPFYWAQTLLVSLSQTAALEMQYKIPAIPSSGAEAATWAGPCVTTGALHHQMSSCNSRLGPRLAFTRNARPRLFQGVPVGSLVCGWRVSFHFPVQLVKGFLETRSLHFTWVHLSAKSCFKLLFPSHIKWILR